jgi:hypothetical protein
VVDDGFESRANRRTEMKLYTCMPMGIVTEMIWHRLWDG